MDPKPLEGEPITAPEPKIVSGRSKPDSVVGSSYDPAFSREADRLGGRDLFIKIDPE